MTYATALARVSRCRWTPLGSVAIPGTASPEDAAALEPLRLAEEAAQYARAHALYDSARLVRRSTGEGLDPAGGDESRPFIAMKEPR